MVVRSKIANASFEACNEAVLNGIKDVGCFAHSNPRLKRIGPRVKSILIGGFPWWGLEGGGYVTEDQDLDSPLEYSLLLGARRGYWRGIYLTA